MLWKGQYAGQVISLRADLFLREISDNVGSGVVDGTYDVEPKGIDIVVQSLVVQKELGQKAEVLAVNLVVLSIDFVDTQSQLAVYFCSGGCPVGAGGPVFAKGFSLAHVFQAELADV